MTTIPLTQLSTFSKPFSGRFCFLLPWKHTSLRLIYTAHRIFFLRRTWLKGGNKVVQWMFKKYKDHQSSPINILYIVMENPHWNKSTSGPLLLLWNTNENWSSSIVSFLFPFFDWRDKLCLQIKDCLLTPFFSHGIYFMRKDKKVNWKLIPKHLINGHWRMHSNLCAVQLFYFKPHTSNYSLLSPGVNVIVAHSPHLIKVV